MKSKNNLGINVAYELARGNDSAENISIKYNAHLKSVRWYIWKMKKKN